MGFFLIFRLKIWLDFFLKSSRSAMFFKQFKTLFQMSELYLKRYFTCLLKVLTETAGIISTVRMKRIKIKMLKLVFSCVDIRQKGIKQLLRIAL